MDRIPRAQFLRALIAHLKKDRAAHRMIEALPDDPAARVLAEMERAGLDRESAWNAIGRPDLRSSRLMPLPVERWPVPGAVAIESHARNDVGFFEATLDSRIQLHMERQQRALWILRLLPWALLGAASLLAIVLGWRWQRWTSTEHRRLIALLLGLAIAIPFTATLIELYPLFFVLDRPRPEHIAQAVAGALNSFAFAVLLDGAVVLLFLISRALRR